MIKYLKLVWLLAIPLTLNSCAPKVTVNTYWVNSMKGECTGVVPMQCLFVQQGESIIPNAWENFYAPIQGFDFEMGYLYQIQVEEKQLAPEDIAADASSITYSLVKILKKEADPKLRLNNIWVPTSLFGKVIDTSSSELQKSMVLEIHLKDKRVMGSDGCNNFNGNISTVGQDVLKFGPIMGTRMMCQDMVLSDKFNKALNKVEKYEIKEMILYLYCEEGNELMTLKKVD